MLGLGVSIGADMLLRLPMPLPARNLPVLFAIDDRDASLSNLRRAIFKRPK